MLSNIYVFCIYNFPFLHMLSKICNFKLLYVLLKIYMFLLHFRKYLGEFEKRLLILKVIKIITSCQKKPCFVFRRTLRVFHFLVFSFLFPFYFFSFSFLFVFVPSDVSSIFVPLQRVRRM